MGGGKGCGVMKVPSWDEVLGVLTNIYPMCMTGRQMSEMLKTDKADTSLLMRLMQKNGAIRGVEVKSVYPRQFLYQAKKS